jgi:hypothetical protein
MSKYATTEVYLKDIEYTLNQYSDEGFTLVSCTQTRPDRLGGDTASGYREDAKYLLIFLRTGFSKSP